MSKATLRAILSDMENDIYDVQRFGELLHHLSTTDNAIEGQTLHIVATPLHDIGERLREAFDLAFRAAGGDA